MLILNQITYDESHITYSILKKYRPLFIKLIHGYTASIACNI